MNTGKSEEDRPDRARVRELLVENARTDRRIVAAAAVGGSAEKSDRWSDFDLFLGVAEGEDVRAVLDTWTATMRSRFNGLVLFDLPFMSSIYRVFLLPGMFQVDLSFTPARDFGALGPRFELLFGQTVERRFPPGPTAENLFGLGVHHAVRGYISIQRGRRWQAEYWISSLRDHSLMLACLRHNAESRHGRGFDELPSDMLSDAASAIVREISPQELTRALVDATHLLLSEGRAHEIESTSAVAADLSAILDGSTHYTMSQ